MRDFFKRFTSTEYFYCWNILLGWCVFLNALITYLITVEPTVSFWDSGEYIATSAKLEIAHPPGAPFYQMVGSVFSFFALDKTQIALMVNYVSCISSAFTILFMFWTLTILLKKLTKKGSGLNGVMILGSAVTGCLAFTYSDSFWFNAVETEVYAMASLIMSLLVWLGLKWVDDLEHPRANRWLLLICFLVGLTFGIQFMGFLTIPTIVLFYFFKRYPKLTFKKFVVFNIVAIAVLMLVFKFSLTLVLELFGWAEVFFVNQMGLPFNSGSLIMLLCIILLFYVALTFSIKKKLFVLNTVTLCVLFLFLGFTSWIMLPMRANAHVAINENDPSDARSLLAYYNREQYPSTDGILYGAYYSDRFAIPEGYKDDNPKYEQNHVSGKYEIINDYKKSRHVPNAAHTGPLPRMWSSEHAENYMKYFGVLDFSIKPEYRSSQELVEVVSQFKKDFNKGEIDISQYMRFLEEFESYINVEAPSLGDNIKYLWDYQFHYMYFRYLMWNFVGRKNDVQGRYNGNGEWLSGIKFLDGLRLGSQQWLSQEALDNKGRNTYFFLPFLMGIVGFLFQAWRNPKQFWALFVFFLFSGLAIQFYTNPPIFQPRERDYSLVGSFYAFSIWIGIGVYGLFSVFQKHLRSKRLSVGYLALCLCAVPLLMAFQNWDDHDRSNRYTARASAKAYLDSTQQDAGAILFTIGDNDNFPLWYLQEIEEYRTDIRVIVTGYFATDWYIDQMKRKSYQSEPIPSQLSHAQYRYGTRDYVYHHPLTDKRWDIKDFMNWISSDHPQTKRRYLMEKNGIDVSTYPENELNTVYYPTNKIRVPVNKDNVIKNGLVNSKDEALIVDYIDIDLPSGLYKNRILMLDILANNDWERPIYFSGGSFDDSEYLWMKEYLQQDGLAYKLVPFKTEYDGGYNMGRMDSELSYKIVKQWDWGNSGNHEIYHDPQTRKQFGVTFRLSMARLVETLIIEDKLEKAKEVLEMAMLHIPFEHYGYYVFVEPFVEGFYKVGELEEARKLFTKLKTIYQERLHYCSMMSVEEQYIQIENILADIQAYKRNVDMVLQNDLGSFAKKESDEFNYYVDRFGHFIAD